MRVYSFAEARQKPAGVPKRATSEAVIYRRDGGAGATFVSSYKNSSKSPFDVPGVDPEGVTTLVIDAMRHARAQPWRKR